VLGAYSDPLAANQGIARERPVRQMREYIDVVRKLLALDAPVSYEGEIVRVNEMLLDLGAGVPGTPIEIPIYLGATGDRMLGLLTDEWVVRAGELIRAGAQQAGRDGTAIERPRLVDVAAATDPAEAYGQAREMVAMYLGGQPHIAVAVGLDPAYAEGTYPVISPITDNVAELLELCAPGAP
jgi:5,10-methylenetetrahydromethanopterin reductase